MTPFENETSAMAWVALASPAWIPLLKDSSEVVGYVLPLLGAIWLIVQIWSKVILTLKEKKE